MYLNYQHLFYFYRTAQKNSFSEAARSLRISQPALSIQIRQFEAYWGFPLFLRIKGRIPLTEEGRKLFEYAKAIFELGEEAEAFLTGSRLSLVPALRLGISAAVPKAVVKALLELLYQFHPDLRLTLKEDRLESMAEALTAHRLDLILHDAPYQTEEAAGVRNHLAATLPMAFFACRKLAAKHPALPGGLNDAPLILPTAPDQTYHAMQNYIQINRVRPRIVAEVESLELVRTLAAAGVGLGLLNVYAVENSPEAKKLAALQDRSRYKIQDTIYLISRERRNPHPLVDYAVKNFRIPVS